MDYDEELPALKAVWQEEFNVHFPGETIPVTPELMEDGWLVNEDNCAACHSNPRWAFVSYPVSIAMTPVAGFFNKKPPGFTNTEYPLFELFFRLGLPAFQ